jgi:hypothetical protein
MLSKDAIAGFRERGEQICRPQAACRKARAYLLAQMLKAALLGKKDQAIAQTQHGKGRRDDTNCP